MKKLSFLFAALVAGVSINSYGVDYTLIPYSSAMKATGSSQINGERGYVHAIDGSGLTDLGGGVFGHTTAYQNTMWMTSSSSLKNVGAKFYCVDLGGTYNLGRIKVWNFNMMDTRGIKDVKIYVTDNPDAAKSSVSDIQGWGDAAWEGQFTKATGKNNDPGMDPITITGTSARFVAFVFTSSYGDDSYQGLSEVQFYWVTIDGEPKLSSVGVKSASGGTELEAEATLDAKAQAADIAALAYSGPDAEPVRIAFDGTTEPGATAVQTLTGLESARTYAVRFESANSVKTMTNDIENAICAYQGVPTLTKKADGQEKGCVPVEVTVSRASADPYPLTVNYTVSSSDGVEGVDYVKPEGVVTIPANETSAVIHVVPLVNPERTEDVHVSVALANGAYLTVGAVPVTATIVNASIPTDVNVWVAGSISDGLASTASNWSKGVPSATNPETLVILLSGNYSSHDMTWDGGVNGLATTVTSWTQDEAYLGTVTINTTYPVAASSFKTLQVTGTMTVDGGTLTHPLSVNKDGDKTKYTIDQIRSAYTYRLNIEAGSFTLGAGAKVDLVGKGMSRNKTTAKLSTLAPVHGGQYEDSPVNCYGNPKYPEDIGWAGNVVSDRTQKHAAGGGAFKLKSTGDVVINGEINVDGEVVFDSTGGAAGAAGSVLIEAKGVSGSGKIHADGLYNKGKDSSYDGQNGAGGRIAILTADSVDLTTLVVSASAEVCGSNGKKAQTGTVYVKDASMGKGVLYVRNLLDQTSTAKALKRATTVSEDGDWSFDQIVLSGNVQLFVPEGKTLSVPTFEDINCPDATRTASLFVKGSLDFAKATKYTLSGNWNFAPLSEVVFDGDLEVKNGANLGVMGLSNLVDNGSELPDYASIKVKVNGDMTIAQSGMMAVVGGGVVKYNNTLNSGHKGVLPDATHGGRNYAYVNKSMYAAYDSVFAPHLPGNAVPKPNGQYADQSAGVITLAVSGMLTVDGAIDANGSPAEYDQGGNCAGGVGGSIDITAGHLLGAGEIRADGGSKPELRGAGGRVAVKLTDKAADFASFAGNISAGGRVRQQSQYQASNDSSAGTIYLQTGAEGEKCGTIRIAQRQSARTKKDVINGTTKIECDEMYAAISATTEIVSLGYGGDQIDDYKSVKVEVKDFGHAAVNADVKLSQMTVATDNAFVDLEGHVLTVSKFVYFDGTQLVRLNPGTYTPAQLKALGVTCVRDSVGGGALLVKGTGMVLLVR